MIPKIETASFADIKIFQEQKLQEMLVYLESNSPFYQRKFASEKIDISNIKTLEDLKSLPVTTKEDLQKYNPIL